jgi:methylenetetrahydrofolate dehydrogenase (NADP+)/methenyltetrahydrofolate cyclohydrolase
MIELKGKPVADSICATIESQMRTWAEKKWRTPHLVVVLVGDDPASEVYVSHKDKACQKLNFKSTLIRLPKGTSESNVHEKLESLNQDSNVDAILLQLPLPSHLDSKKMTEVIDPKKDADGLTQKSLGALMAGRQTVASCTPAGIIKMLEHYQIDVTNKNVVVVGRSLIVGLPLFHLLLQKNATVTLCHSKTENIKQRLKEADIVFVAIGKPNFFKASDFKKDATVIDVGIHRLESGICGDVDSSDDSSHLAAISPVPGGVGPLTIAMLMQNTFTLAQQNRIG